MTIRRHKHHWVYRVGATGTSRWCTTCGKEEVVLSRPDDCEGWTTSDRRGSL